MLLFYNVKIHRQLISVFFTIFQVLNLQKFTCSKIVPKSLLFNGIVKFCNNFPKNPKVFKNCADIHSTKGKNKGKARKLKKENSNNREKKMGLNVSTSMGFENKEILRSTARNILVNSGASQEAAQKVLDSSIFESKFGYQNPQLSILKASTQINLNNSLKETLKYLRTHSLKQEPKQHLFGELWNILETTNESSEKNPYEAEIYNFIIDENVKNIFAA